MNRVSRRAALIAAAASSVALAVPVAQAARVGEHPLAKARRLARELSETLSECKGNLSLVVVSAVNGKYPAVAWMDGDDFYRPSAQDADLLRLGAEFDRLTQLELAAKPATNGDDWTEWDRISDQTGWVVDQIEVAPASTLDGLRVKARAMAWCQSTDEIDVRFDQDATDLRIANSIVRSLLAIA